MIEDSSLQPNLEVITVIAVGDMHVGKTTAIQRACNRNSRIIPTVGVQFCSMTLVHKGREFHLKFWDMSGHKKYQAMFAAYAEKSNVAIVFFDLTDYETYHNAKEWVYQIRNNYEDMPVLMFGNKKDLYNRDPSSPLFVQRKDVNQFAQKTGVMYEDGCALSDGKLVELIKKMLQRNFIPNEVILQGAGESKSCFCC